MESVNLHGIAKLCLQQEAVKVKERNIQENGEIIRSMDSEAILGAMEEHIKDNGRIIRCTVLDSIGGRKEASSFL